MIFEPVEMTEREVARQHYRMLRRIAVDMPAKFGATELPELPAGAQRMFFSKEGLLDSIRFGDYERLLDGNSLVTRLGMDGRYAVDVVPQTVGA